MARAVALGLTLTDAAATQSTLLTALRWWIPGMVIACGYTAYTYKGLLQDEA